MDIGTTEITNIIIASTTDYLVTFSPVFLLMGGLLLAFVVIAFLISSITGRKVNFFDDDDTI